MSAPDSIANLKARAEAGDLAAQRHLGWIYEKGQGVPKDLVQSLAWYRKAATQGLAVAQNDVGCAYRYGMAVEKDADEAVRWFRMSANQGDSYAQYNLACMLEAGQGAPQDYAEAARYYHLAAEQGHPQAAFCLGWLYRKGQGVPQNDANAIIWYRKAAEKGDNNAQAHLAWMYYSGTGCPPNQQEAIRWWRAAAKQGNKNAIENLAGLNIPIEDPAQPPPPTPVKNHNRNHHANSVERPDCKPLLAACTPLVYVHNAFRITGLPVDASTRDIKRRVDDLKAAAEMGDDDDEHTHAFALTPPPEIDHIREAARRLHEPERRIIEELFWFWPQEPGQGRSDRALRALQSGDKDAAFKLWSAAAHDHDEAACIVAKHNLAVMYQMVALDSEILALTGNFSDDQLATVSKYWTTCFKWWEELSDDETFWSLVADRIRTLDDHRLTTGFARRMRASFPIAFDQINAMLALQYAEKGKYDHAKRHIAYMNQTHQGSDDVDRVISDILKPLETRVNNAVEAAVTKSKRDVTNGAEIAKELLDATKQPLAIIRSLLDEGHAIRSYLFDLVYDACSTCLIAYGNKTEDWLTCVHLLKQTESLVPTEEARNKLRTNIAQAEENHRQKTLYAMCWFCKMSSAEETAKLQVPMYGDVQQEWVVVGTRYKYRTLTASVPRCPACKKAHSTGAGVSLACIIVAALIGSFAFPVGTIVGGLLGWGIGAAITTALRPANMAPLSAKAKYPPIQDLLSKGWKFGDSPS